MTLSNKTGIEMWKWLEHTSQRKQREKLTVDKPPVGEVRVRLRFFDHVLNEAAHLFQVRSRVHVQSADLFRCNKTNYFNRHPVMLNEPSSSCYNVQNVHRIISLWNSNSPRPFITFPDKLIYRPSDLLAFRLLDKDFFF